MLSPNDMEHLRIVRLRTPISENKKFFKGVEFLFKRDTFILFEKLLRMLCDLEVDIEDWRRKLSDAPGFRLKEIFNNIDLKGNGYLTKKDVRNQIILN